MPINLSKAYSKIDGQVLNRLLGNYKKIRFIGVDQDNDNKRIYLTDEIEKGFYYKRKKKGYKAIETADIVKIVPENEDVGQAIADCVIVELKNSDDDFLRLSFSDVESGKHPPQPPSFEWVLFLVPNYQDKKPIAE